MLVDALLVVLLPLLDFAPDLLRGDVVALAARLDDLWLDALVAFAHVAPGAVVVLMALAVFGGLRLLAAACSNSGGENETQRDAPGQTNNHGNFSDFSV